MRPRRSRWARRARRAPSSGSAPRSRRSRRAGRWRRSGRPTRSPSPSRHQSRTRSTTSSASSSSRSSPHRSSTASRTASSTSLSQPSSWTTVPGSTPSLPAMSDPRPASSAAATPAPLFLCLRPVPARRGRPGCGIRTRRLVGAQPPFRRSHAEGHDRGSSAAPEHPTSTVPRPAGEHDPSQHDPGRSRDRRRASDRQAASGERVRIPIIRDGLASQLPDIDPDETAEWLESLDAVIDDGRASSAPAT